MPDPRSGRFIRMLSWKRARQGLAGHTGALSGALEAEADAGFHRDDARMVPALLQCAAWASPCGRGHFL